MINFLRLGIDFAILRREQPFILGLAVTDICNLSCRHCWVANAQYAMMSYSEVRAHLESGWRDAAGWTITERGAIWVHRLQSLFSLTYIDELWKRCQDQPWLQRTGADGQRS